MNPGAIAAIAYGLLAIGGGIMGYTKSQSKMSLISGSISGVLLLLGGIVALQGISWGLTLAAVVTIALIAVFAVRLFKTQKFMPAGLMIGTGAAALGVLLWTGIA